MSDPITTASRTFPNAAQLEALCEALDAFPWRSIERGKRYAAAERVESVESDGAAIKAIVRGTRAYRTRWSWVNDQWQSACTCPVSPDCKHAYALGCVILVEKLPVERLGDPENAERLPARLVRQRLDGARTSPLSAPAPIAPLRSEFMPRRAPLETSLIPARGHRDSGSPAKRPAGSAARATSADQRALERIRTSRDTWERMSALAELLIELPLPHYEAYRPPYSEIVLEPDADMRCWLLAQTLAGDARIHVPPVLVPFLERDDLAEQHRKRAEGTLVENVIAWTRESRRRSERSVRLEFEIVEGSPGLAFVEMKSRLSSRRMHDEPRSGKQLRQLLAQARRTPGLFPPDQIALLELIGETDDGTSAFDDSSSYAPSGTALLRVLLGTGGSPLVTWGSEATPALLERAGITPGAIVRLSPGAVHIAPVFDSAAGADRVELRYVFPDGSALGARELVALHGRPQSETREPSLVIANGAFWLTMGEPPDPIAKLFAYTGGFDLPERGGREIVAALARAFPSFRASLGARTHVHAVRSAVTVDLREDDWIQLRAFAIGDPDWRPGRPMPKRAAIFEYDPSGNWGEPAESPTVRKRESTAASSMAAMTETGASDSPGSTSAPIGLASTATAASEVLLELPDPERTEPIERWFEATGAESGEKRPPGGRLTEAADRRVGWWMKLGPRSGERFARAWDERPPGVEWYGNDEARRMLAAPQRVAPRLRIQPSGVDWFSVSAEWEAEGLSLTDEELAKLRSSSSRFVKLPSGWARRDRAEALDSAAEALAEIGIEPGVESQRVSLWQLAHARPEAIAALEGFVESDEALRGIHELRERVAAFAGLPRVALPRGVEAELRPYQHEGLDFLAHTASLGLGAVLADDMGLGKTVQALAWLVWLGEREPKGGPSLVVCPASVLHNWERESRRFTPGLRVLLLSAGSGRHALRREIARHDLVVTNYALMRRDLDELAKLEWRAVILDEAQNVKNPDAAVSRAARTLRARHRLALTGTPLENRALDLWSIMAFVNPGYLGTRASFERRFDRPDAPAHARRLLSAKLRPVLLRRLKHQVAPELPPRIEERRDCEMTSGQRKLYLAELATARSAMTQFAAAGGIERNKISILAVLTRLRQVCCHPALIGGRPDVGSGKFEALFELLEPLLAEGHKVLVFSQFVECLKLISAEMRERGIAQHMLTGQTTKRAEVVAAFESAPEPCAFLISLRAGGTGLNLTAANYVVLFDPWWNPAVEAQAIDRTHRIGQDRTVIAYRMLTEGSIEERIWDLQQRKAALVSDVLGEDGFAKSLTRDDLEFLLAEG